MENAMSDPQHELQPEGGWAAPARPRLTPPPPSRQGWVFRGLSKLSRLFGRRELPRVFPVFNIHGRLFWPWLWFASRLMPYGKLPAPLREVLILRTAWNCRSRYEWGQHVEIALSVGVDAARIVALSRGPRAVQEPVEAAAVRACDQLCADQPIDEDTWHALAARFGEKLLIEMVVLVGHYRMLAGLLVNSGIALEPAMESVLVEFNRRATELLNTEH
tara:strand:+ start:48132 stop:48785 length:654 start_codon:yes stop_codon:yes gene_type:complete